MQTIFWILFFLPYPFRRFVCVCLCGFLFRFFPFSGRKSGRCSWRFVYIVRSNWPTINSMWSHAVRRASIATKIPSWCSKFWQTLPACLRNNGASGMRCMAARICFQPSSPSRTVHTAFEWKIASPSAAKIPASHWSTIEGKRKAQTAQKNYSFRNRRRKTNFSFDCSKITVRFI